MDRIKFYSTRNRNISFSFRDAVMSGLAPDGGLFMPHTFTSMPPKFWNEWHRMDFHDVAMEVFQHVLKSEFNTSELHQIVANTLGFDTPLIKVNEDIYSLELFHGPTLAFKDFGARFLAAVLSYYALKFESTVTILVATSGDTGSAVAHGFFDVPGTRVVVLYPSGKVSDFQEKQFTTLGKNIMALEVEGTFDDCQRIAKLAFADKQIQDSLTITSANSINIARLLSQMLYYFRAIQQWPLESQPVVAIPSGNLGNLTAGIMAKRLGLPISHFIAASNRNDVITKYLETGNFNPKSSISTISNAMDVGNPSNFERIFDLFDNSHDEIIKEVTGFSFSDNATRESIEQFYQKYSYLLDPHSSVACLGLRKYIECHPKNKGIILSTAHPAKFIDVVEETVGEKIQIPESLSQLLNKEKKSVYVKTFEDVKDFLIR